MPYPMDETVSDLLVIGGGPAGSAAATRLAQRGRHVVLLERYPEPRYHIGESLLPCCYDTLDRLGVLGAVKAAGFVKKQSVQFVRPDATVSRPFYFSQHLDTAAATTWQVTRSVFDKLLLDNARDQGVRVLLGTQATELMEEDGAVVGARAAGPGGEEQAFRASITIDASGRDGLGLRQRRWRVPEPRLDRLAIWTYYEGALRESGRDAGATTIASLPTDGWFWFIPLADDLASVGVVARPDVLLGGERDPEAAFSRQVEAQPWIADRLAPATRTDRFRLTRNYSYHGRQAVDGGLMLCGDAFAFVDPVFSAGIFLALTTGEAAALAADEALDAGRFDRDQLGTYQRWLLGHIEPMRQLVFAFYDPAFRMGDLVRDHPDLAGDITDILIGNVDRDFSALMEALDQRTTRPGPMSDRVGPGPT